MFIHPHFSRPIWPILNSPGGPGRSRSRAGCLPACQRAPAVVLITLAAKWRACAPGTPASCCQGTSTDQRCLKKEVCKTKFPDAIQLSFPGLKSWFCCRVTSSQNQYKPSKLDMNPQLRGSPKRRFLWVDLRFHAERGSAGKKTGRRDKLDGFCLKSILSPVPRFAQFCCSRPRICPVPLSFNDTFGSLVNEKHRALLPGQELGSI